VSRDMSVDIATRHGRNGPTVKSRKRRDSQYLSRAALGTTQPPTQWVLDVFAGAGAAGGWR